MSEKITKVELVFDAEHGTLGVNPNGAPPERVEMMLQLALNVTQRMILAGLISGQGGPRVVIPRGPLANGRA
jgi:hypothetical protein